MSDRPRESLQALQAKARGGNPWACRLCGCTATEVVDSRQRGAGPRKRLRRCLHCKEPSTTQEIPVPDGYKLKVVPEDEPEEVAA